MSAAQSHVKRNKKEETTFGEENTFRKENAFREKNTFKAKTFSSEVQPFCTLLTIMTHKRHRVHYSDEMKRTSKIVSYVA